MLVVNAFSEGIMLLARFLGRVSVLKMYKHSELDLTKKKWE